MSAPDLLVATPEEMRALGERLAASARPGDLIVLTGDLGAGKTTLVQGIGAGLGVGTAVLSPTFVIARVHRDGRFPLVHVDAYRLGSVEEVDDLDLDADLEASLTVVEWGEGLVERLAADRLEVRITRSSRTDDEVRHVRISGVGRRWDAVDLTRIG
jgi:tRNA threonylcarbamoyladenosine biosynthesis protein TsaE